ncbi:MAG: hypothetical protein EHM20_16750 [Alphaproteobacteria bacterium]|nr:MAG: hypothetical protein EHM20_16750 [Alphaproteobacteria bacterium]
MNDKINRIPRYSEMFPNKWTPKASANTKTTQEQRDKALVAGMTHELVSSGKTTLVLSTDKVQGITEAEANKAITKLPVKVEVKPVTIKSELDDDLSVLEITKKQKDD